MEPKRIYVLNGHPAAQSLNRTLAESYADAARAAGHDVRMTHLHDLDFDPDYGFGGYVNQNYVETAAAVGLTRDDILTLARNSFTGSFLSAAEQQPHLDAIDKVAARLA